ncbi:9510_t:CDS:1, partial [Acaulospora morrowiae]
IIAFDKKLLNDNFEPDPKLEAKEDNLRFCSAQDLSPCIFLDDFYGRQC